MFRKIEEYFISSSAPAATIPLILEKGEQETVQGVCTLPSPRGSVRLLIFLFPSTCTLGGWGTKEPQEVARVHALTLRSKRPSKKRIIAIKCSPRLQDTEGVSLIFVLLVKNRLCSLTIFLSTFPSWKGNKLSCAYPSVLGNPSAAGAAPLWAGSNPQGPSPSLGSNAAKNILCLWNAWKGWKQMCSRFANLLPGSIRYKTLGLLL